MSTTWGDPKIRLPKPKEHDEEAAPDSHRDCEWLMFIVYSVADNGVRHAWGPFRTKAEAMSYKGKSERRQRREETRWLEVTYSVHRVLQPDTGLPADWPGDGA